MKKSILGIVMILGFLSFGQAANTFEENSMTIITQYYEFLSQKDFKNACLLKNTNKDCEKKLKNTYTDILIAVPSFRNDSKVDAKNSQITFSVYYEDKKTLRSSVYIVTKKIVNNKITDISSKLSKPVINSIISLNTKNKNIKIYKKFIKYNPVDEIFTGTTEPYRLYKNENAKLYELIDHSNLIGNGYTDKSWKKNGYSKELINDIFIEGGLCGIGAEFYAVKNLLGYKKGSNDFIKDYTIGDLGSIEPVYAGSKYLLFSDLSRCGQLRTMHPSYNSYTLKIQ